MFRFQLRVLVLLLVMLGGVHSAAAFSTEKASAAGKGDASNLTDPDDQVPAFLKSSDDQSSGAASNFQSPQMSVNLDQNTTRERLLGLSGGYDRAYLQK
jgi:hypothetical protein